MKRITIAMTAALGLGLFSIPAAAAPGAATATGVQAAVPAGAGVTNVGWRGCGLFNRRCRADRGAHFGLRAPGVGVYIGKDRDRYRHRYHDRRRLHSDRRWAPRWRRHRD